MKKTLLIIFAILTSRFLPAQPLPQWSSSISSNFLNYTYDNPKMKMDNAGDLVVVASVDNGSTGRDIIVIKYTPSGSIIWQQIFNGISNQDDVAGDFGIDSLNNIFITGGTATDSVNSDLITFKYFPNGSFDWLNTYSGAANGRDMGQSIDVDQTGNSYVTGYTSIDTSGNQKLITAKIDSSGNTVWTDSYGADSIASYEGNKIRILNNEIAVLGRYISHTNYIDKYIAMRLDTSGTSIFANEGIITRGMSSYHIDNIGNFYFGARISFKITKVNANGNFAWLDSIPTNLPFNVTGDELKAITSDTMQNIYVTGRHYGDDYGGPTYSNADILVIKYAPGGNQIWSRRYEYQSNNAADIGNDITLDNNMNIYVAGQSERQLTDYDYVVIRYDVNGTEIGSIRYNDTASGDDVITSMVVEDSVNIYVT
ncbi:MAG TPA: SBBP repeat-containing protein, partial [Bacteroidia bacterium]|nr:SBBP repeat-containing protein [Bacteroidia bacterium]